MVLHTGVAKVCKKTGCRDEENFATEKQARQILALSMLTQVHAAMMKGQTYVDGRGGSVYEVISLEGRFKRVVVNRITPVGCTPFRVGFYTKDQREHFIKHNKGLIHQYTEK